VLPYLEIPALHVTAGLDVQPYGALVVLAIVAGALVCALDASRVGLSTATVLRALWWSVGVGLLSAHAAELLFYHPMLMRKGLATWLHIEAGLSSIGGFFGGFVALWLYARSTRTQLPPLADLVSEGLVVGWCFGRLGCTLVHDHPGRLTDFALAVRFPDGPRHDLGLYELAFTLVVLLPLVLAWRRQRAVPGVLTAVLCVVYGTVRFGLDFLRATDLPDSDPRYRGLTAAQWGCLAMVVVGLALVQRLRSRAAAAGPTHGLD